MSAKVTKPEKDLCRCCHSEGSYKSLYTPYFWLDVEEVVYSTVLRECYDIELLEMRDLTQQMLCTICYTCIQRLEEAVKFKRQIQKCEKRFRNVYEGCVGKKECTIEVTIKQEPPDADDTYPNGMIDEDNMKAEDDQKIYDGHDSDKDTHDSDMSFKSHNEEGTSRRFKGKCKKTKAPLKAKVKKEVTAAKVPGLGENEDVEETIAGVIKVVKRPLKVVKRGVNYKETEEGYQCLKCPEIVKTPTSIRMHIRTVHYNIPKFKCPVCSEAFATVATFMKHKLEDHNIDHRLKCNACDHMFNTKAQLKKHINTFHMLGAIIKCADCDYETFNMESLYKHKFKHKTVKDYKCKFCKKAFVRRATLELHVRIHTGDRRKVCAVCGQAFVQKASLNYHMTKYHPEVPF